MASPSGNSPAIANNVFIPTFDGDLQVGFSRNPRAFKLPRYAKMTQTPKIEGYYLKLSPNNATRQISTTVSRTHWPTDQPRPAPQDPVAFRFIPFVTKRHSYGWRVGELTAEQAAFNIAQAEREAKATLLMTERTARSITVLTTASNWQTTADADLAAHHTATTSAAGFGDLSAGSSTDPRIKNAINYAFDKINLDTVGVIDSEAAKFFMIMNPTTARALGASQEYVDYLKGSPDAAKEVEGRRGANANYGLPSSMYGVDIIVENAVYTSSEVNASTARSYLWPDATIAIITRVGELDGVYGGKDFSTYSIYYHEDITTEEFPDKKNRLLEGFLTENVAELLTCPGSGYLYTACLTD